jgi:hypothetical protein
MRRFLAFAVAMSSISCMAFGDDSQIKSPLANAAIAKCDKAIAEAEKAEKRAEVQALREMIPSLEKAVAAAIKAGDLAEANALNQKIKETKDRIESLSSVPVQFRVVGNLGWQKLGQVVKGQHLRITAEGEWTDDVHRPELTCGPDGLNGKYRLFAQINGTNGFPVGSRLDLVVPETGPIEFGMAGSSHVNGGGKLIVTITLLN